MKGLALSLVRVLFRIVQAVHVQVVTRARFSSRNRPKSRGYKHQGTLDIRERSGSLRPSMNLLHDPLKHVGTANPLLLVTGKSHGKKRFVHTFFKSLVCSFETHRMRLLDHGSQLVTRSCNVRLRVNCFEYC